MYIIRQQTRFPPKWFLAGLMTAVSSAGLVGRLGVPFLSSRMPTRLGNER